MRLSIGTLALGDISWPATDVHLLMSCLSITQISNMNVMSNCMIKYSPSVDYPIPRITVNIMEIDNPIRINTLNSLLSQLDLHPLILVPGGTMNDMLSDTSFQKREMDAS